MMAVYILAAGNQNGQVLCYDDLANLIYVRYLKGSLQNKTCHTVYCDIILVHPTSYSGAMR
jgi:hypothetical protein